VQTVRLACCTAARPRDVAASRLSKTERAGNVQAAFRAPKESKAIIRGKRIVLVDDVLTSGATVDACARALFRGGALNVDVIVFACVVDATT